MTTFSYSCTALQGTNKTGALKPDGNGYYDVILGALNYFNTRGEFYPVEPARKLLEESSILMRRITNGNLRGEYGHPRFMPGMSKKDFLYRIMDTYEDKVCMHIAKVEIDETSVKGENGSAVIVFRGRIKPSGPYGDALRKQLDNPEENVCFSVRSITDDYLDATGTTIKCLKEIYAWDYVNEPGLKPASKWQSPSLENLRFNEEHLVLAHNLALEVGNGLESDVSSTIKQTIKDLKNYKKDELINK
jgi:hypothetical protein